MRGYIITALTVAAVANTPATAQAGRPLDDPIVQASRTVVDDFYAARTGFGECPNVTYATERGDGWLGYVNGNFKWDGTEYVAHPVCRIVLERRWLRRTLRDARNDRLPLTWRRDAASAVCRVIAHERGHTVGIGMPYETHNADWSQREIKDNHPATGPVSDRWEYDDTPGTCRMMARRFLPRHT